MDDRRRNRDLPHFNSWRDIAGRASRALLVLGAVSGWLIAGKALHAHFFGG